MDLTELLQKRRAVEAEILRVLREFEDIAGLTVRNVILTRNHELGERYGKVGSVEIEVLL